MSSEPEGRPSRLWRWYAAGGMAAIGTYFALPRGGLAQALVFVSVHLSVLVALIVGVRVHRPQHASIWYVIVVGEAFYAVANLIWYPYPVGFDRVLPYPSIADAVYLCGYAVLLPGLALLVRARAGGRDRAGLTDTAIVTIGLGVLSWIFFMRPVTENDSLSGLAQLTSISYLLIDIVLLGILVRLVFSSGGRLPSYRFLAVGLMAQLVADTWYTHSSLEGTFSFGGWFFVGWLAFYVLLGTAALHPSMRQLSEPSPDHLPLLTGRRLAFLAAAALISPAVLAVDNADRGDQYVLAGTSAALFLLVVARMRGLVADITEHERITRLKDEFTSMVSHELRTPLTSIRGALGLVAAGALGPIPDKAQRMLDIANDNTERLVRLINDILDIQRMESGRITLEKSAWRADRLVAEAADAMRAMADHAGVTLTTHADDAGVWADKDRTMQTLINLVSNAVKFSPRGSAVGLSARNQGKEVVFAVEDEGRGIAPEQLERIFSPFHQVDSSDSREKGGTGLGLAICRSIVGQHGGRIWAESTLGRGSTFRFTLPAATVRDAEEVVVVNGEGPTVLVCDDDPELLEVLTTMLVDRGYQVIAVTDPERALEEAAARQPAAVVLDLLMPGMNGCDTLAALKRSPITAHLPVVIVSVLSMRDLAVAPAAYDAWLDKPIDADALFGALKEVVTGDGARPRVLLVEDDDDLADVLSAALGHHGLAVTQARTGHQAVELARQLVPAVLVLDLMLPDTDGFEVVEALRREGRLSTLPLVVYTAKELDDSDRRRLRLGPTSYFTKSRTPPAELEHRVVEMVERMAPARLREGVAS